VCLPGTDEPGTGATGSGANGSVDFTSGMPGFNFGGTGNGTGVGPGPRTGPEAAKGCGCRVGENTDTRATQLAWLSALLGLGIALKRRRAARA
jgi:MYXO-CTERM domain-containing protein